MSTINRIQTILNNTKYTWERLAKEINIDLNRINIIKNGKAEFTNEELIKIINLFGNTITLDYLIRGFEYSSEVSRFINDLKPSFITYVQEYLLKCKEIVNEVGLTKYIDLLIPTYIENPRDRIVRSHRGEYLAFSGGVFLNETIFHYQNILRPYIDFEKLLSLNNYEIYTKLKSYPRTLGQMIFWSKNQQSADYLEELISIRKKYSSSDNFSREEAVPPLKIENILQIEKLTDINFFIEAIKAPDWHAGNALYTINENNPNYWKIVKIYLDNGAYLTKEGKKDVIKTMMLRKLTELS